jgi:threonine dehydrogenase-like Zn-dependent dehydrogenase
MPAHPQRQRVQESIAMKGVVFKGRRQVELREFPDPIPGPGEVVIAIRASGLCGSDLHVYRRDETLPGTVIGGHEPAGEVVAVGAGVTSPTARVGQRVMVHHYHGCTACEQCRTGWSQLCTEVPIELYGGNTHGAHAEFLKIPADTLVPLDDALSFTAGAAIGCGTGTAWGALERMQLTARDTIAIFGQGPVGLSATMLANALGARVIAVDIAPERLARARAFGAIEALDPREGGTVERIRELTGGKGASKAMETSGASSAAENALACLRKWGALALVGIGAKLEMDSRKLLMTQVTVMTSWSMSWVGQKACADFVVERGLDVDSLFSDRFDLTDCAAAYELFDRQERGKAAFVA